MGVMERFTYKMAIAPTASIASSAAAPRACIEPIPANIYTHKTLSGSFSVKNPYLEKLLTRRAQNTDDGLELDPRARAARSSTSTSSTERGKGRLQDRLRDRPALADRTRRRPHALSSARPVAEPLSPGRRRQVGPAHAALPAWERGMKTLYYCRSKSHPARRLRRQAGKADEIAARRRTQLAAPTDYEECLACQ